MVFSQVNKSSVIVHQCLQFREQLAKVYYDDDDPNDQSACPNQPANVVVVGPIPKDDGLSGTTEGGMPFNAIRSKYYRFDLYC